MNTDYCHQTASTGEGTLNDLSTIKFIRDGIRGSTKGYTGKFGLACPGALQFIHTVLRV